MKYQMQKVQVQDGKVTYYGQDYYTYTTHFFTFSNHNYYWRVLYRGMWESNRPNEGDWLVVSKSNHGPTDWLRVWKQDRATGVHKQDYRLYEHKAYLNHILQFKEEELVPEVTRDTRLITGRFKLDTENNKYWKIELCDDTAYFDVRQHEMEVVWGRSLEPVNALGELFSGAEVTHMLMGTNGYYMIRSVTLRSGETIRRKLADELPFSVDMTRGPTRHRTKFLFPTNWLTETKWLVEVAELV